MIIIIQTGNYRQARENKKKKAGRWLFATVSSFMIWFIAMAIQIKVNGQPNNVTFCILAGLMITTLFAAWRHWKAYP